MNLHYRFRRTLVVGFSLFGLMASGCGEAPPKTHAVTGKVVFSGGETAQLVGHSVELALVSDPTVRAYGTIGDDGRFTVETYEAGKQLSGAQAGTYEARFVIVDEGDGQKKKPKVAPRFLQFKTSGWSVTVPPTTDVTLTVSAK